MGIGAGDEEVIAGAGAGDVEDVAFGVLDFLKVGIVCDGLDALLEGDDLIVASHDIDSAEFQTFGEVYAADGDAICGCWVGFI